MIITPRMVTDICWIIRNKIFCHLTDMIIADILVSIDPKIIKRSFNWKGIPRLIEKFISKKDFARDIDI